MKYSVDINSIRADVFLARVDKNHSRNFYKKLILDSGIKVNNKVIKKPHIKLKKGDIVIFKLPKQKQKQKIAEPSLKVLFEDKYILVIDKPPNLVSEDLALYGKLVHRLDKDTSGVLIIAKDEATLWKLQQQWKNQRVKKEYTALIKGKLEPKKGKIEAPIERSYMDRKKMIVSGSKKAKESVTEYEVSDYFALENGDEFSLVRVYPRTGRTHQIRVHFRSIGCPVVGDKIYGDKKLNEEFEKFGLKRQFLHAEKLKVTHPYTKKILKFTSKLPSDLNNVIASVAKQS